MHVVVHNLISVDGRLDGFPPDLGLYYELAARLPHQAVLSGSGTILAAAAAQGVEMTGEDGPREQPPGSSVSDLPWLVLVDSAGRLVRLDWLRSVEYWRDVLVLCAKLTPPAHVERLERAGVPHEIVGEERVDLGAALALLEERYGVDTVRVDAGPTLNAALLAAGLVDEISVVVAPFVVGHGDEPGLHLAASLGAAGARRLELTSVERRDGDALWLRYAVSC